MVVNISGVWDNVIAKHTDFLNKCIDTFLDNFYHEHAGPPTLHESQVTWLVKKYREKIVSPNPANYPAVIQAFEDNFPEKSEIRIMARSIFEQIFDYDKFKNKSTKGWNAYSLCEGAIWTVCPYCHITGTETEVPDEDGKGYRPQLDHYFSKAAYPFLALSLGNLIPCCARCNGPNFKHQIDFAKLPHLNPFEDDENISFTLKCINPALEHDPIIGALRGEVTDYMIEVGSKKICAKTSASINTFQLNKLYDRYVGEAKRIAYSVRNLAEEAKNPHLHNSRTAMVRSAIGIEIDPWRCLAFDVNSPTAYKNVPTGKMQLDVFHSTLKKWGE